jgi:hypothetical protein
LITQQNHGYSQRNEVPKSWPSDWKRTKRPQNNINSFRAIQTTKPQNVLQSIATINSNSRWNDAKIIKPALQRITAILPSLYVDG